MLKLLSQHQHVQLFTATEARAIDELATHSFGQPSIRLMRRAGLALFNVACRISPAARSWSVYCGKGHNAGDGYITAALAARSGYQVEVLRAEQVELPPTAAQARVWCLEQGVCERAATSAKPAGEVIIDALLGIGGKGPLREPYAEIIRRINNAGKIVVSADLPSGLDADSGAVATVAVRADATVTFIGAKRGLVTGQGGYYAGALYLDDLDLPAAAYPLHGLPWLRYQALPSLPARPGTAHKGHFGRGLLIGGAPGQGGAILLAAEAALRTGIGLLSVVTHATHVGAALVRCPEAMTRSCVSSSELEPLLKRVDLVACGPGLGDSDWAVQLLSSALAAAVPLVLDADALNLMAAGRVALSGAAPVVITPHPGEAARLLNTDVGAIAADRYAAAAELGSRYGAWVILKGAGSVLAAPDGRLLGVCGHGNPGMATGGMGDVLTGLVLGLWAQIKSPEQAISMATCVHSLAADRRSAMAGPAGLLASDLPNEVRLLLNGL